MATYTVTKVRKEDGDGHQHLEGVITNNGQFHTRQQVYDSIAAGDTWKSQVGGSTAFIKPEDSCVHAGCPATPYIRTNPDSDKFDNLENLPEG